METKLNYKRTFYIGFAFFTIMLLWQVYNYMCPIFLEKMGVKDSYKGLIMAADNIFALFMLPVFGTLSDKVNTKLGKRMPFIIVGTILAAITFPFVAVLGMNGNLLGFLIVIAFVLFFMNIYRAPAVALMPDLTPKKYHSKANGIINLMGGVGGIFAYGTALLFGSKYPIVPFIVTSALMVFALIILYLKVKENAILKELKAQETPEETNNNKIKKVLTKAQKINLILILAAVFCWFFGVNAVETFWSTYSWDILFNKEAGKETAGAIALLIFTVSAIVSYLPGGIIATKTSKKSTILIGIVSIATVFFIASFLTKWNFLLFIGLFVVAGFGWALINVNSYPMVVEYADGTNGGKFTSFYYTASQFAQTITPFVIGTIMDFIGRKYMFPYAVIFLILSFIFMFFTKTKKQI